MSKLTVVYLKDTGHVLAALSRADPPEGDEPVGALVGTGLPVSFIDRPPAGVTLPARDLLAAVTVDDDQPEVLINPQNFQVVQDPQGKAAPQVTSFADTGSQVGLTIDTSSGAKVTVADGPSGTQLPAVVVLQKATSPSRAPTILSPVTITAGSSTVVADQTGFAKNDQWNMYAFVQGLPPAASETLTL